jgi:hypothetical protein
MRMPAVRNTMCTMADGEGYRGRSGISLVFWCVLQDIPFSTRGFR